MVDNPADNGECFHCYSPASARFTVILESVRTMEDKLVCNECLSGFRETDWVEVYEAPVLKRGNTEDEG